jgi:hypothetical protein
VDVVPTPFGVRPQSVHSLGKKSPDSPLSGTDSGQNSPNRRSIEGGRLGTNSGSGLGIKLMKTQFSRRSQESPDTKTTPKGGKDDGIKKDLFSKLLTFVNSLAPKSKQRGSDIDLDIRHVKEQK